MHSYLKTAYILTAKVYTNTYLKRANNRIQYCKFKIYEMILCSLLYIVCILNRWMEFTICGLIQREGMTIYKNLTTRVDNLQEVDNKEWQFTGSDNKRWKFKGSCHLGIIIYRKLTAKDDNLQEFDTEWQFREGDKGWQFTGSWQQGMTIYRKVTTNDGNLQEIDNKRWQFTGNWQQEMTIYKKFELAYLVLNQWFQRRYETWHTVFTKTVSSMYSVVYLNLMKHDYSFLKK